MEKYTRKSAFTRLKDFDHFAKDNDYMEITLWKNGEGFDVDIDSFDKTQFRLTWGEYDAVKKLIKFINKND